MIFKFTNTSIICVFALLLFSNNTHAQPPAYIPNTFSDTLLCVNGSFQVPIIADGSFADTNVFRVEISDSNGNFSHSILVGNLLGDTTGTSYCTLPSSIIAATGYRLRIVAVSPPYTSASSMPLRVSDYPSISLTSNSPVCEGDNIQLSATSPNYQPSFSWTGPNGFSANNQQNTTVNNVSLASEGTYTGTVVSYKCATSDTITVSVTKPPKINVITPPQIVCEDGKMNIVYTCDVCSATPGFGNPNREWTYPSGSKSQLGGVYNNQVKLQDSGLYILKVSIGSCFDTASSYLKVKPLPDTPTVTHNGPLCVGETLQLDGNTPGSNISYKWEGPNGFSDSGLNAKASVPNIPKAGEGEYKLYAYQNGCASKPGIADIKLGAPLKLIEVTGDTLLCPGDNLQLSAQTNQSQGIRWIKLPDTAVAISVKRTFGKTATTDDSGVYVVTQEIQGCKSPPAYVHVNIPNIKWPDAKNNGPLCIGDELKLTAAATANGTYAWAGPGGYTTTEQNPTRGDMKNSDAGDYTVSVSLAHCTIDATTVVGMKPKPEITAVGSNSPVCTYTYLNLNATSSIDNSTFEWTGPGGFTATEQNPSVYFLNNESGTYYVKAIADGCASESMATEVVSKPGPGDTKARNNGPLIEGEELLLFADNTRDSVTYVWTGPEGFTSSEQNPVIPVATYRYTGEYEVLSIYNTCTTSVKTYVDVKDILGLKIDLYPNPNDGLFTIRGLSQTDELMQVNIFNHQGRTVYTGTIQPDKSRFEQQIDLRGMPSGVYLIQVYSGIERKSLRFTLVQQ